MQAILNNKIQESRLAAGLTQVELAEQVGVTRQTIISMEKGNYVPSVVLALRLAQVFDCQIESIFTEAK
jgi:putative transcriptional regulator